MDGARQNKIYHPELFQGNLNKKMYFEGWYFKQVASEPDQTISFIPGISLSRVDKHAFIQVIIAPSMETHYFKFDIETFTWSESMFHVQIDQNIFSSDGIKIELKNEQISIRGDLRFSAFHPIKQTWWMPNMMGVFGYLPFMECNHGVISMDHNVSGTLQINETLFTFNQSKGYLEKDWGRSFPKNYCWLQCNEFEDKHVSFMFSRANVPFLGLNFSGFICNLVDGENEYRFATYTGAKVTKITLKGHQLEIMIKSKKYHLTILAESQAYGDLIAPKAGVMNHIIKEGIQGKIQLYLTNRKGACLLQAKGKHAGIEIEESFAE